MEIRGIDVSKYQKSRKLDYNALKRAGYDFAILRAGFGMYASQKDQEFEGHYLAAGKADRIDRATLTAECKISNNFKGRDLWKYAA